MQIPPWGRPQGGDLPNHLRMQIPPLAADPHVDRPPPLSVGRPTTGYRLPLTHVNRMKDASENITLPQTSFAVG